MADESACFLDLATRPLAEDPEMEIHARRELESLIVWPDHASWQSAAKSLERRNRSRWWHRPWLPLLVVGTLIAVVTLLIPVWKSWKETRLVFKAITSLGGGLTDPAYEEEMSKETHKRTSHLSPEQQFIFFGDASKRKKSERLGELWKRYPDNPSYYADYAIACWLDNSALPTDYNETAARIDPDNGWFPSFAAAVMAKDAVTFATQTSQEKKDRVPKKWTIREEGRLQESMALLARGNRLPCFDAYEDVRATEQIGLLPPATDAPSYLRRISFSACRTTSTFAWRQYASAISARAQELASSGDREGFLNLVADWRKLLERQMEESGNMVELLIAKVFARFPLPNFIDAPRRLGLEEEASHFEALQFKFDRDEAGRKDGSRNRHEQLLIDHGSFLTRTTIPMIALQAKADPPLDVARLAPNRRMEHTFFLKLCYLGGFVIVGLYALGCLGFRFRHGLLVRKLSHRLAGVMRLGDWLWIFGVGGLLPIVWTLGIQLLTPLGGRDWNIAYTKLVIPSLQLNAWAMLMLVSPIVIARWRLKRRLPAMDFPVAGLAAGWSILIIAYSVIPLAGLSYLSPPGYQNPGVIEPRLAFIGVWQGGSMWTLPAFIGLWIVRIWVVLVIGRALLGPRSTALGRQIMARLLVPAYVLSMLFVTLITPVYQAQERRGVAEDTVMGIGPDTQGVTRFENEVVKIHRQEILEMLSVLDKK